MSGRWYIVLYPSFPMSWLAATGCLCVYAHHLEQKSALVSEWWQRELEILSFACKWYEKLIKSKHAFSWLSFSNLLRGLSNLLRGLSNFNISHVFRDVLHVQSEDILSSGRFSSTMDTLSPINILRFAERGCLYTKHRVADEHGLHLHWSELYFLTYPRNVKCGLANSHLLTMNG